MSPAATALAIRFVTSSTPAAAVAGFAKRPIKFGDTGPPIKLCNPLDNLPPLDIAVKIDLLDIFKNGSPTNADLSLRPACGP